MFRRLLTAAVVLAALAVFPNVAEACPMCKAGAEADDNLPNAFFASIMLMLAVPGLLFGGFGVAFWRLSKRADDPQLWRDQSPADGH